MAKTKKKSYSIEVVDVPLFGAQVYCEFGSLMKDYEVRFNDFLSERGLVGMQWEPLRDITGYYHGMTYKPDGLKHAGLWIANKDCSLKHVCHEALHVTSHILRESGIEKMTSDNEELFCYLQGFIFDKVINIV